MEFSDPIFVAVFIIIVAYAIFGGDPAATGALGGIIAAILWAGKTNAFGAPAKSSRLATRGFDPDLAGAPEKFDARRPASHPAPSYLGAVDAVGDGESGPGRPQSGSEANVLQADEEYARLTRMRDQYTVRAQTGVYQRRDMMAKVLDDELRVAEDRVWWGRADA